jgi:hypothetical protein
MAGRTEGPIPLELVEASQQDTGPAEAAQPRNFLQHFLN